MSNLFQESLALFYNGKVRGAAGNQLPLLRPHLHLLIRTPSHPFRLLDSIQPFRPLTRRRRPTTAAASNNINLSISLLAINKHQLPIPQGPPAARYQDIKLSRYLYLQQAATQQISFAESITLETRISS